MDLSQPLPPLPPAGGHNRLILVILAVLVVLGLAVAGVLIATNDDSEGTGSATPDPSAPPVACGEVISKPVGKSALHVSPPDTVDYADAPPAFGDHWPAPASFGRPFYSEDRPTVEELVHNMEHGYTIAWYDETAAADEDAMDQLKEIAVAYQQDGERFIAAPWLAADGGAFPDGTHVALTRWSADPQNQGAVATQRGNWQYCGTVDPEAIKVFFKTWPNQASAEPGLY